MKRMMVALAALAAGIVGARADADVYEIKATGVFDHNGRGEALPPDAFMLDAFYNTSDPATSTAVLTHHYSGGTVWTETYATTRIDQFNSSNLQYNSSILNFTFNTFLGGGADLTAYLASPVSPNLSTIDPGLSTTTSSTLVRGSGGLGDPGEAATLTSFSYAAVPEPATWLTMVAGLGMVGIALRKRSYDAQMLTLS